MKAAIWEFSWALFTIARLPPSLVQVLVAWGTSMKTGMTRCQGEVGLQTWVHYRMVPRPGLHLCQVGDVFHLGNIPHHTVVGGGPTDLGEGNVRVGPSFEL